MIESANMDFEYAGTELEIFQNATVWKRYFGRHIQPFLGEEVAEVGAGIGATTKFLVTGKQSRWLCLEPDASMADAIRGQIHKGELPASCSVKSVGLEALGADEMFDSIVYLDVLEHIEDDAGELKTAARHLKPDGYLIMLSPAHQGLYTPFDKKIGHFRRYDKDSLAAAVPLEMECVKLIYLDSVGALASLGNRLILRSATPSNAQIQFWDKRLVPISKIADRVLGFRVGKSILGVWQNTNRHE